MSLLQRVCKTLGILSLAVIGPAIVSGQSGYVPQAGEYLPAGGLPGDQTHPRLSLSSSGGFLVWDDNITDGSGLGISAVKLDSSFSPSLGVFRVNQQGTNDQEKPNLALLSNGGAAFVWQGGKQGFQHIYARFLSSSNTWVTGDVQVNTSATKYQVNPSIAALTNGNVVVTWSSYNQEGANSLQGVYAQILSPSGQKVGSEFMVNQFTSFNQRTPAVTGFMNGNFLVTWVSEQQRFENSVDIYARLYSGSGAPLGNEFLVNTSTNVCANPAAASAIDGTFIITWSEKDVIVQNNSWDISARQFSSTGTGGVAKYVNTQRYGDQFAPQISVRGTDYMVIWTSMGQDGSREGVYGQFLTGNGSFSGTEFRVNTTTASQQFHPAIASDNAGRFVVAWSGFTGLQNSFDLYAQRFAAFQQPLLAPDPPLVSPISSSRLTATWPPLAGFNVSYYELFIDGSPTGVITTNNMWTLTGLAPATTHAFRFDYVLADGRHSPLSGTTTAKTWDEDNNGDGIPDDWQALYWGANSANWPPASTQLSPYGPTIQQVFQWGSNPLDPSTWLTTQLTPTPQGLFLSWNTKPGYIYQVESSTDFHNWTSLGALRFAAGTTDSVYVGLGSKSYYRIKRVRY
ncbi:MAG: hypothetical protein JWQ71_4891 [Pedosphaera sp.]|nr:hypothetical protein [Pedosphaera sp.]